LVKEKVQQFLDELFIKYTLHSNVKTQSTFQFSAYAKSIDACAIKVVLFSDQRGPALIAFAAHDGLDFETLNNGISRSLALDSGQKYKKQLQGFSIRNLPPFGRLFNIPMIADEGLLGHQRYLIDVGLGDSFIEIDKKGFYSLFQGAKKKAFTRSVPEKSESKDEQEQTQKEVINMGERKSEMSSLLTMPVIEAQFKEGVRLPAMPEVAKKLVTMKTSNKFELVELVQLIESDPVISAKIVAYSTSPFFAYQGKLETVQEAIYHVLGVELTLNIALAIALGQQFKGPMKGPVGAMSVWRHAVYSAVLAQSIATKLPNTDLKPGTAYLYGLIHNIGFLALGHVFPKKFSTFNKSILLKQELPLETLEKHVLGVSHTSVGALLIDEWGLPDEFKRVIGNHHDDTYEGLDEEIVHTLVLTNVLLKSIQIGDAKDTMLPLHLLDKYNLKEKELMDLLEMVLQWHDNLDNLASRLVA